VSDAEQITDTLGSLGSDISQFVVRTAAVSHESLRWSAVSAPTTERQYDHFVTVSVSRW
jgi:hypothetical protein